VAWAAAIAIAERTVRAAIPSRSRAWILTYAGVVAAAGVRLASVPRRRRGMGGRAELLGGLGLAVAGYPAGRWLLGDRPDGPPPEPALREAFALGAIVAPAEELAWGALVEPVFGARATGILFAGKHVLVDGRWKRAPGLASFWWGLAVLRRRSRTLALAVHVALNLGGVLLGHATQRDRF
jgi:hypothetical protein